jgi:hypothetical protein
MSYRLVLSRNANIFSNLFSVLGVVDWCEANDARPAVRFDSGPQLDPERGPNWWEYYFERLSEIDPMSLPAASDQDAAAFSSQMERRVLMNRERAADIIRRHVRIRPELNEFVTAYWQHHMAGRFAIGLHIRRADGTDQGSGLIEDALAQIEHIVRGRPHDTWRVFVVTDDREFWERVKAQFGDHAVRRDAIPGKGDDAAAAKSLASTERAAEVQGNRGYHTGLAALQDAYLLSRCDVFLGCPSRLSSFVAACNPKMPWVQLSDAASSAAAADELKAKERVIQELYQTAVERANLIERLHETAQDRGRTIDLMHSALTKRQSTALERRVRVLERQSRELTYLANQPRTWRDKLRPTLFTHRQHFPRAWSVPDHYTTTDSFFPDAPTIAIVTPSFNHAPYIERTIRSVLDQNYPALRYTVQDGGSTDETQAILAGFGESLSWVAETDDGQADAINRGFARVEGDIMAWLNSDDTLLPGALDYVARFFCARPDIDVVYGHRVCVDEFDHDIGRVILPRHDPEVIKWIDYIPQETMFWRRRVWDKLGGIDRRFHFAMDWDFILRAHAAGFHFYRLPRFLGCFRISDAQKTASDDEIGNAESAELRMRYLGRAPSPREHDKAIRGYLLRHVLTVRGYKLRLFQY